ncbi:hypothetical protein MHYP_G00257540 [Metynnis hypsauchen]
MEAHFGRKRGILKYQRQPITPADKLPPEDIGRFPASLQGERADKQTQPRSIGPEALLDACQSLTGQANEDFRQHLATLARDLLSCIILTAEQLLKKNSPKKWFKEFRLPAHSVLKAS